jgi:hypothetical protein
MRRGGEDEMADEPQWWYCLRHKRVESDDDRCPIADLLGPYKTRDEAEHALERAAKRTEDEDERDYRWDELGKRDNQ